MFGLEWLRRVTNLLMEIQIIGAVSLLLCLLHFTFLWERRRQILAGTLITAQYALPIDALAITSGWGAFNPNFVSGVYFLRNAVLLEEIAFWVGTVFVTISAVLIFADRAEWHPVVGASRGRVRAT